MSKFLANKGPNISSPALLILTLWAQHSNLSDMYLMAGVYLEGFYLRNTICIMYLRIREILCNSKYPWSNICVNVRIILSQNFLTVVQIIGIDASKLQKNKSQKVGEIAKVLKPRKFGGMAWY